MPKGQQPRSSTTPPGGSSDAGKDVDQQAGNRTGNVTGKTAGTGQRAGETGKAEELKARGKEAAEELKTRSKDAARKVKDEAEHAVERRTTRGAEQLDSIMRALQSAADRFEEEGRQSLARYTRTASQRVERMSGYLRDEDAGSMLEDLEEMARSNPATFLGTTFAAGVAAGRFLRASAPERTPAQSRRYATPVQSRTTYPGKPTRTPDEIVPGEIGNSGTTREEGTTWGEGRI